jgi:hypothetical protein
MPAQASTASVNIIYNVNVPPTPGQLIVTPASTGIALQTIFRIQLSLYEDSDQPLMYRYCYYTSQSAYQTDLQSSETTNLNCLTDFIISSVYYTSLPAGNIILFI